MGVAGVPESEIYLNKINRKSAMAASAVVIGKAVTNVAMITCLFRDI
jgi:putative N-acetylmannosamine-6-phosphate epimerase